MRLPMEASAVNNSYGQGFRKTRAHQAPDRRVPERCRSRVALPRAHTFPLLLEARAEPTSACKRFLGAILRANAKDREFPRQSAGGFRYLFPPSGGHFFRSPCDRASVARGHDAVLSLRYRSERFPERTAPASLRCSLGPGNGTIRLDLLRLLVKLLRKITCKHDAALVKLGTAPPNRGGPAGFPGSKRLAKQEDAPIRREAGPISFSRGQPNRLSAASDTSTTVNDPSAGSPTETLLRLLLPSSTREPSDPPPRVVLSVAPNRASSGHRVSRAPGLSREAELSVCEKDRPNGLRRRRPRVSCSGFESQRSPAVDADRSPGY